MGCCRELKKRGVFDRRLCLRILIFTLLKLLVAVSSRLFQMKSLFKNEVSLALHGFEKQEQLFFENLKHFENILLFIY